MSLHHAGFITVLAELNILVPRKGDWERGGGRSDWEGGGGRLGGGGEIRRGRGD